MPVRINETICKTEEETNHLLANTVELIKTEELYAGSYADKINKLFHVAFNINDCLNNKVIMKCIFTIHEHDNTNEIIDIDYVMPNDNLTKVKFIEKSEESSLANEMWQIEFDDYHVYIETVNRHCYFGSLQDKEVKVSLSLFPYDQIIFADSMDEINKEFGFKPTKYEWQETVGMGSEPITLGFSDKFVGMEMYIGKILEVNEHEFAIFEDKFKCLIASIDTGLGILPAMFSIDYKDQVIVGKYTRFIATTKVDLSTESRNYYK